MFPRPRLRLPIWAALTIVGAAYLYRGLVLRSGDLSPDVPGDLLVLILAAVVIIGVAIARIRFASGGPDQSGTQRDEPKGNGSADCQEQAGGR